MNYNISVNSFLLIITHFRILDQTKLKRSSCDALKNQIKTHRASIANKKLGSFNFEKTLCYQTLRIFLNQVMLPAIPVTAEVVKSVALLGALLAVTPTALVTVLVSAVAAVESGPLSEAGIAVAT